MAHADPHRIHELEYELGFRDDPPPLRGTDKPGTVLPYKAAIRPATYREFRSVVDGLNRESGYAPRRPTNPQLSEALTRLYLDYIRKRGQG